MHDLLPMIGNWFWWIAAAVLLLVELLAPGIFLMWLGLAAATVGLITSVLPLPWQGEALLFAALAVAYVYVGRPWYAGARHAKTDQPNLNQRINAFVGKTYVLEEPIINGQGKLNIDGSRWDLLGPDLAKGSKVHVTAVDGMKLRVKEG
jgi:membrane protein implicated in regulation of membrane protease activity